MHSSSKRSRPLCIFAPTEVVKMDAVRYWACQWLNYSCQLYSVWMDKNVTLTVGRDIKSKSSRIFDRYFHFDLRYRFFNRGIYIYIERPGYNAICVYQEFGIGGIMDRRGQFHPWWIRYACHWWRTNGWSSGSISCRNECLDSSFCLFRLRYLEFIDRRSEKTRISKGFPHGPGEAPRQSSSGSLWSLSARSPR